MTSTHDGDENESIDVTCPLCIKLLYERHYTALKYFAIRYVSDPEVARDILHDTFVRILERGGRYNSKKGFMDYLYRSLKNNCLTHLRSREREKARIERLDIQESEESFLHAIIESELHAIINEVFMELPPATRKVYQESLSGKSHKEIAEELKIAVNTIKKHKTKANNYLRNRLDKLLILIVSLG